MRTIITAIDTTCTMFMVPSRTIARVHPVNVKEEQRASTELWVKPTDLEHWFAYIGISVLSTFTAVIYYYSLLSLKSDAQLTVPLTVPVEG